MLKRTVMLCMLILLAQLFLACSSVPKAASPLWIDESKVEQIFPREDFITGIAHADTQEEAAIRAEANLAAYFTREINSVTKAHQTLVNTGENRESIDRDITVKSQITLAGVQHTQSWRNVKTGIYYACAYLNRKEAFANYESIIISAQNRFYSFYNAALNEQAPFKKIALFTESKIAGQDYSDALDFSLILYKPGYEKYEKDISVIASVDEKILQTRMNISMKIIVTGKPQYKAQIESVFTEAGYSVKETNAAYTVLVTIQAEKAVFEDTIVVQPAITCKITDGKETILSFTETANPISGFKETERVIDMKVNKAITGLIESIMNLMYCRIG